MCQPSFPLWERVLKSLLRYNLSACLHVVPLVGTWIEISSKVLFYLCCKMSFPLWERGLKFRNTCKSGLLLPSFPLWERGLKSSAYAETSHNLRVVPLVGTWIEMHTASAHLPD